MGYPSGVMGCDVVSTHVSVADYAPKDLGVLMRLYYPTERAPPFFKLFRPRWEPSVSYAAGRAHFLFNFNERPWWFKLLAKILYTGQHIASFETIPASLDAPPASRGLPVIVFSHGLSGCRNMYSALCTSLAARGYMPEGTWSRLLNIETAVRAVAPRWRRMASFFISHTCILMETFAGGGNSSSSGSRRWALLWRQCVLQRRVAPARRVIAILDLGSTLRYTSMDSWIALASL